ncbi:hypothetical protein [Actinomadura parmotrematis]|uniref:S-layer protein C-terminal domain-containing protein n=1 Tax=Actinomadura parmotrematis TaxID=2864039 RepID=A0ABS7FX63_9ACTN|nr:hypothetical protein [Actinomadura parmotrematis]MBW8484269.1 hypothetical protein [Actinomadura parmotrematis]
MAGFWLDIEKGLVSDVLFAGLVASSAVVVGWWLRRRRVRRFFGVVPGREVIRVVLPGIEVLKSATLGTAPVREGFSGVAINEVEYRYALALAGAVESRPLARALFAAGVLDQVTSRPVVCRIEPGPSVSEFRAEVDAGREQQARDRLRQDLGSECVVLVGGPVYNVLTHLAQSEPGSPARTGFLRLEESGRPVRGIEITEPGGRVERFLRSEPDGDRWGEEYLALESFRWHRTQVFLCAGTCTAGTAAAVRILADWRTLQRRFGGEPFTLVYRLPIRDASDREREPDLERVQPCYVSPRRW